MQFLNAPITVVQHPMGTEFDVCMGLIPVEDSRFFLVAPRSSKMLNNFYLGIFYITISFIFTSVFSLSLPAAGGSWHSRNKGQVQGVLPRSLHQTPFL